MDKIEKKIIFDATVLVDGNDMKEERRGIYFVAKNLLREFNCQTPGRIILYATGYKIAGLDSVNKMMGLEAELYRKPPMFSRFFHKVITFFRKKRMENFQRPLIRKCFAMGVLVMSVVSSSIFYLQTLLYQCPRNAVFFSPRTSAPRFIRRDKGIKKFIVLHDLIPYLLPEYANQKSWGWFGYLIRSLNKEDHYFAISEATKKDFCSFSAKIDPSHVHVVYWGVDRRFAPCQSDLAKYDKLQEKYRLPKEKKYVFSLCSLEPRKNLVRMIRTFIRFVKSNRVDDLILVVAGGEWLDFKRELLKEGFEENEIDKYLLHVGYVEDQDLPFFYNFAQWFVFTSRYEGFGLPPLEAMSCGCPVITSNNSSLPEVVGDAGIMVDWDSDEQHIAAYEKYYFDDELRMLNSHKGLQRAKLFSWDKTVDDMVSFVDNKNKIV